MKILKCPINGPRPIQEFIFGGEYRPMPDPNNTSNETWADYVFKRAGEPGIKREWWYHLASGTWFIAEHDTVKDVFIKTYLLQNITEDE